MNKKRSLTIHDQVSYVLSLNAAFCIIKSDLKVTFVFKDERIA